MLTRKKAATIGGVTSRGVPMPSKQVFDFVNVGVFTLLPPGQAGRRAEREDMRFEFWCPVGSCQLWLPRGQAHMESSLPSGLSPMEATIGSTHRCNQPFIRACPVGGNNGYTRRPKTTDFQKRKCKEKPSETDGKPLK